MRKLSLYVLLTMSNAKSDEVLEWMRAVANWMKADPTDPELPPPAPVEAIIGSLTDIGRPQLGWGADHLFGWGSSDDHVLALAEELRQTRAKLDAIRAQSRRNDD